MSDEVMRLLRARHEIRVNQLPNSLDPTHHDVSAAGTALTRDLIAAERKFIHDLLRDGQITDETRRRIERDLDLEEASLANREYRGGAAVNSRHCERSELPPLAKLPHRHRHGDRNDLLPLRRVHRHLLVAVDDRSRLRAALRRCGSARARRARHSGRRRHPCRAIGAGSGPSPAGHIGRHNAGPDPSAAGRSSGPASGSQRKCGFRCDTNREWPEKRSLK